MNSIHKSISKFAIASAALGFTFAPFAAFAGELTLDVKGISSKAGNVMVAVYKKDDKWLGAPSKGAMATVKGDSVTVSLGDLPEGEYAISLFVDENSNGKMDFNALGIPTEAYGFSNDATGNFGPPTFEKAKFSVGKDATKVTINLK
jgi:uncharacterized protein (DUF2141 family)